MAEAARTHPPLEVLRVFLKLGLSSFGGPIAHIRHIGRSVFEHLRLRSPHGEEARQYNVLQKLTYLAVLFGLLPFIALTGLTTSAGLDARLHFLTAVFGGRQSARSVHFITATALVMFFLIHIVAVLAAGPLTEPAGVDRRRWLQRALALAGGLALSACDRMAQSDRVNSTLDVAEG
jgi:hypothetical protein